LSPNQVFPSNGGPLNPIAARVLQDQNLTYDVSADSIVIAAKSELLVRKSVRDVTTRLDEALSGIATNFGSLGSIGEGRSAGGGAPDVARAALSDVEVWRIDKEKVDRGMNSIDAARRLRVLAEDRKFDTGNGPALALPAVSPNHVGILSPAAGGCPAGPPHPAPPPPPPPPPPERRRPPFIGPIGDGRTARVAVLDSGYIEVAPPHAELDARVTSVRGLRLDTSTTPPSWVPDKLDSVDLDGDGRLDGIAGHGTFIAGLIAHICPHARLTVVGLRNQEVEIEGTDPAQQSGLYETEAAIAHAMLLHSDTDVIQCGFAFPTLDDYPSLPFAAAMQVLTGPDAPRKGVAVVSPAGNEESPGPYWPAALPDVIGVASTNRHGNARAKFSNWGRWCDCCARGEDVYSTYIHWTGPIDGEPPADIEHFIGWARWDGTSFAAPKVSAAIACQLAESLENNEEILPVQAWDLLVTGATGVQVSSLTDTFLTPFPGVTLPHLHLG
jgi:subtilisin family serine protease